MAVVPFAKGPMQSQQQMPSEANLLMALAQMHAHGRMKDETPRPPLVKNNPPEPQNG